MATHFYRMHLQTILISLMVDLIVTNAHVKNINVRMLNTTCENDCRNTEFAICFNETCFPTPTIEHMVSKGHCLSNFNDINGKETAMVSGSQLINNFTFRQIDTPISGLHRIILGASYNRARNVYRCEDLKFRNVTTNGIIVEFAGLPVNGNRLSFEILIEVVCENATCRGQMCDICGTATSSLTTTDISTTVENTTHLPIQTTHFNGHTRDTTSLTTIQTEQSTETTTHELLPITDMSTSRETTTHLPTQTTYFTGHSGHTTNRPSPTKQSGKFTESTTHRNTKTDVESTSRLSTSTMTLSAKTTNNATTPAVSKNSTSQIFTTSSNRRYSTTVTKPTMFVKYVDSTISSSSTVTGPTTVTYSSTNKSLSNSANINEEVENSKNVRAWAITTTAVGIVEMIIIVLLIGYIRWLKIQMRTASSSQEFCSQL